MSNRLLLKNGLTAFLCICGFAINYITYHPGFMSPDTFDQYNQTINNTYATWHPPAMAYAWHLLNFIHKGPALMLCMQLFFLWFSCFLFALSLPGIVWRLSVLFLFFAAPFIQNFSGWIVKDSQMALSWLLAVALLFYHLNSGSKKTKIAIAVCAAFFLLYGSWMRYNAVTGLFPLCLIWAWVILENKKALIKLFSAAALLLVIVFGQKLFINVFLKATVEYTEGQIYFHDLNGIFLKTHRNVYPPVMYTNPEFDTTYIRGHYDPIDVTSILYNHDHKNILVLDESKTKDLKDAWIAAIKQFPVVYLKNRYDIYLYFLTLKKVNNLQYYFPWIHPNQYGYQIDGNNYFYQKYCRHMQNKDNKIYFQVWFWIFLNVLLFFFIYFIKDYAYRMFYACVVCSGFLYTLPQFITCNSVTDFRYIYWSCLACTMAVVILMAYTLKSKKPSLK